VAVEFWLSLLRCRDDTRSNESLRHREVWLSFSPSTEAHRLNYSVWYVDGKDVSVLLEAYKSYG
jgi:hypothetical protein